MRFLTVPLLVLFSALYFSQSYTIRQSGFLIDVIAIENVHHFMLVLTPKLKRKLITFAILAAIFCIVYACCQRNEKFKIHRKIFAVSGILLILQIPFKAFLPALSPVLDLTAKTANLTNPMMAAYRFKTRKPDFIKQKVYNAPFPYKTFDAPRRPNVFIIFTEGLSARTIGAYNPRFKGLTPNIDAFAKLSMKVENYYNHTAATEKGILGQLTSFYPAKTRDFHPEIWETPDIPENNYRSIAHILQENGYESYFLMATAGSTDNLVNIARKSGFKHIVGTDQLRAATHSDKKEFMTDEEFFDTAARYLEQTPNDKPVFAAFYNLETHAFKDTAPDGTKYGDGSNSVLNTVANYDLRFGKFFDWFEKSKFADDTILILTADHAHFFEPPYIALMTSEPDYKPFFVDRIPLIIFAPFVNHPETLDAKGRNSLALAPTILHYLGIQNAKNHFIGHSLFDSSPAPTFNVSETGLVLFFTDENGVHEEKEIPDAMIKKWREAKENVLFCIYTDRKSNINSN